ADGARLEQPARRGALGGRGEVSGDTRAARRRQPLVMAEVLEPHGDAMKWPAPSARRRVVLERARPPEGALLVEGDEGADAPVVLTDALQAALQRLDGRERASPDRRGEGGQALLRHRVPRPPRPRGPQ